MSDNDGQEQTNNGDTWTTSNNDGWANGDRRSASPSRDDRRDDRREDRRDDRRRGSRSRSPGPAHSTASSENVNPGNNLFVTGISQRLSEREVEELFSKYGKVDKCSIMLDPHTRESRGFGFVTMETVEAADAAIEAITGMEVSGRTISVEKAKRGRARTPTPGRYHGPPKREDRRGGYGGGYSRGGDRGYGDRAYGDRGYDRGYDRGDRGGGYDRGYGRDRYDDRRGGGGYDDRRGGGRGGYDDRRGGGGGYGGGGGGRDRDYDRRPPREEERW